MVNLFYLYSNIKVKDKKQYILDGKYLIGLHQWRNGQNREVPAPPNP